MAKRGTWHTYDRRPSTFGLRSPKLVIFITTCIQLFQACLRTISHSDWYVLHTLSIEGVDMQFKATKSISSKPLHILWWFEIQWMRVWSGHFILLPHFNSLISLTSNQPTPSHIKLHRIYPILSIK